MKKFSYRFDLRSLLFTTAAIAFPFGLTRAFGLDGGFLVCIAIATVLLVVLRKWSMGVILLTYVASFILSYSFVIYDVGTRGPYVRTYNQRLYDTAMNANLVGASEELVETTLGPATDIYQYPNVGWPYDPQNPGYVPPLSDFKSHEITTTYNYAPYPCFPFAKFQVHCREGRVESLEMYDD